MSFEVRRRNDLYMTRWASLREWRLMVTWIIVCLSSRGVPPLSQSRWVVPCCAWWAGGTSWSNAGPCPSSGNTSAPWCLIWASPCAPPASRYIVWKTLNACADCYLFPDAVWADISFLCVFSPRCFTVRIMSSWCSNTTAVHTAAGPSMKTKQCRRVNKLKMAIYTVFLNECNIANTSIPSNLKVNTFPQLSHLIKKIFVILSPLKCTASTL